MVETVGFHQEMWFVMLECAKDRILGVDPRTTFAATCLVWNNLMNKPVHSRMCLAGGVDYRFKCVILGVCKVQLGRVKCVQPDPSLHDGDGV
jgi:hypothetical protein